MIGTKITFITDNANKLTGTIIDKVASIKVIEKFSHTTYASGSARDVYEKHRYPIDKYVVQCDCSVFTIEPDIILKIIKANQDD